MSLANALEIETFKKLDNYIIQVNELPAVMDKSIAPTEEELAETISFYGNVKRQIMMMFTQFKKPRQGAVAAVDPFKKLQSDVKRLMDEAANKLKKLKHEPTDAELQQFQRPHTLPAACFAKSAKNPLVQGVTNGMPIYMIPTTNRPQIVASTLAPPKIKPPTRG